MLADTPIIGFIPVRNLDTSQQFYCDKLGLKVLGRDGFALVLEAAQGVMIRCVVTDSNPLPFTILGWEVEQIHSAVKTMLSYGVQTILYPHFAQDADGVWTAPDGSMVAWFNDPFGNVLSLSQHMAARR